MLGKNMNKDEKIVKVLKKVIPILSILTIFNFVMLINKKSYALFEKHIETDTIIHIETADSAPAVDIVKSTLGQTKGVIGVKSDNSKTTNKTDEVREYRYSGLDVNNYIYFNCETEATEQNVDSKCETWRIVGIFKDERGSEHLKIVRNEVIKQANFPDKYTVGEIMYNIKSTDSTGDTAFWDKKNDETYDNNWETSGLQYWLNAGNEKETKSPSDGYMSYLSKNAKSMIEDTKYYLGTVTYYNQDMNGGSESVWGVKDTVNEAYKNERAVTGCDGEKGLAVNTNRDTLQSNETCRVWANNPAIWEGKIALLYPSDYGYSADSKYWNTKLGYTTFDGNSSNSSWLQQLNHSKVHEWFISPSSSRSVDVAYWGIAGHVGSTYVADVYFGVRPTLYLKSNVRISSGTGEKENPFLLKYNQ